MIKIAQPTRHKRFWLEALAQAFSAAVQYGLDGAHELRTGSRDRIHQRCYPPMRACFGLPFDYARVAVNAAVSRAQSYYGLRQSKRQKRTSFPKVAGSQGMDLGVSAYAVVENDGRWVRRCSTEPRGGYVWLPLCVPAKWRDRMQSVYGDDQLFEQNGDGYVMLPLRIDDDAPPVCDGEPTFIAVDLGIVRWATVSTPDAVECFVGTAIRHRREHVADLRRRYPKHKRLDRVKAMGGPERG